MADTGKRLATCSKVLRCFYLLFKKKKKRKKRHLKTTLEQPGEEVTCPTSPSGGQ